MIVLIIAFITLMIYLIYLFATLEARLQKQWYEQHKDELNESIKWRNSVENKQSRKAVLF